MPQRASSEFDRNAVVPSVFLAPCSSLSSMWWPPSLARLRVPSSCAVAGSGPGAAASVAYGQVLRTCPQASHGPLVVVSQMVDTMFRRPRGPPVIPQTPAAAPRLFGRDLANVQAARVANPLADGISERAPGRVTPEFARDDPRWVDTCELWGSDLARQSRVQSAKNAAGGCR